MGHPKSTSRKFREEFDRDRTYTVQKAFTYNGKPQAVHAIFDKDLATTRRLRQLYESRYLNMAASDFVVNDGRPAMPNFPRMAEADLREYLAAHGLPQKDIARHIVMVGRAVRKWYELNPPKGVKAPPTLPIEANPPPAPEISPVAPVLVANESALTEKARAPTGRRRSPRVKLAKELVDDGVGS